MAMEPKRFSLDALCKLTGLSVRTVRFYIQRGLVDRPEGEKRGAWYSERHLEQLLQIQKWSEAGLSLEAIARLMQGDAPPVEAPRIGRIEVCSHLQVAEGVELVISPERAKLSPEQLRAFLRLVGDAYKTINDTQE